MSRQEAVMAVRIRKSVWSLPQGDPTFVWYRRAVAEMQRRPGSNPTSWNYQGFIHGVPGGQSKPAATRNFWDQCQHQSWLFLPWHRGYITAFEAIVAKTIAGLGGPADWALPYWNYSEDLATNPNARLMPPDFFAQTQPDGSDNALWSTRADVSGGDFGLDDEVVNLNALTQRNFSSSRRGATAGFGGPVTGFNHGGGPNGALESVPHNRIHVQIGGDNGFMSFPDTAALDPIFWVHHANVDRLWEVWRNKGNSDPNTADWLSAVPFQMHDGNGQPFTYSSKDMLDTTKVLHGYQYDNVPVAHEPSQLLEAAVAPLPGQPELAGASSGPVSLEGDITRTMVSMQTQAMTRSFVESTKPTPRHVYLNLENITGTGNPGDYKVYVHLPNNDKESMLAGVLTTFGLERASNPELSHGGSGIHHVFDITKLADAIGLTAGTANQLQVSFVREGRRPATTRMPAGLESFVRRAAPDAAIKVGRVSVYYD
jgi:tyrosinase